MLYEKTTFEFTGQSWQFMPICHGALVWPSFASSQTALVRLIFRRKATAGEGKRRAAAGLRILAAQDVNKELNNLWWKWLKVKLSMRGRTETIQQANIALSNTKRLARVSGAVVHLHAVNC